VNVESVPLYSISSFECTPVQQQTRKLFLYIIIVPKIGKAVNQWITGKMEKHNRKKKSGMECQCSTWPFVFWVWAVLFIFSFVFRFRECWSEVGFPFFISLVLPV
jgi:hypothetical protein